MAPGFAESGSHAGRAESRRYVGNITARGSGPSGPDGRLAGARDCFTPIAATTAPWPLCAATGMASPPPVRGRHLRRLQPAEAWLAGRVSWPTSAWTGTSASRHWPRCVRLANAGSSAWRATGPALGVPAGRARPPAPPQGPADLDLAALDSQHRRRRPHPSAGEDHDRDPAGHRPARRVRPGARRRRDLRPPDPSDAGRARRDGGRAPLPGDRLRISGDRIRAAIEDVWELVTDPERVLNYMSGVTRWEVAGDRPHWPRRPLPHAVPDRRGGGRRPGRGGRVRTALTPRLDVGDRARSPRALAPARGRPAAARESSSASRKWSRAPA